MTRLTVSLPDELAREVQDRTDNISGFVAQAVASYLVSLRREDAFREVDRLIGNMSVTDDAVDALHRARCEER